METQFLGNHASATDLERLPVALPDRGEVVPDDHDPESGPTRREGLWVLADMDNDRILVLDAPQLATWSDYDAVFDQPGPPCYRQSGRVLRPVHVGIQVGVQRRLRQEC